MDPKYFPFEDPQYSITCFSQVYTMKLGYNELGYNEHSDITNKFLGKIGHFTTQMNPVITKPGYNVQKWPVPSCSL
jgi:hypothetical protein